MEATAMNLIGIMGMAALSLTLGMAAPAYAQQEQHDQQEEQKDKPPQDEKKAQPEKSVKPEEKSAHPQETHTEPEKKNAQPERNSKPEERNAQQNNNAKPEEKNAQEQRTQQASEQPRQRAGNNGGNRIPDDRFKANFGQEHRFRVSPGDYSNRRFEYGGYSFGFVDAWPSNWLYTQDVYVIEINGMYYLCNPSYPGVSIALSFAL